ncbi:E2 domain-containing protein [Micromonospora globispora]|uniref:E2 domain-containing protein n=1 Tax=Micromonospora globispora TaxID=1450148 RepID=UPI0034D97ECB
MIPEGGHATITGTLRLRAGAGIPREFQLRLVYQRSPDGAVNAFQPPDTYEIGGRFPRGNPDRHIESDGRFCLWLPVAAPTDFDGPDGLALHLDRVRQFLRLQLAYEDRQARGLTPAWPGPEWKHGLDGYRQWAQEHAAGMDQAALRRLVLTVWNIHEKQQRVHPASLCPCGSGRIWRSCHSAWAGPLLKALNDDYVAGTVLNALLALMEDNDDHNAGKSADATSLDGSSPGSRPHQDEPGPGMA